MMDVIDTWPRARVTGRASTWLAAVFVSSLLVLSGCGGSSGDTGGSGPGGGTSSEPSEDSSGDSGGESAGGDGSYEGTEGGSEPAGGGGDPADFQSGTLTAGDLDDVLNASLYADYVSNFLQENPDASSLYVFMNEAIVVEVRDSDGEPFPFAQVSLLQNDEALLSRHTPVDGQLRLFPSIDELPDTFELQVSNPTDDVQVTESVVLAELEEDRTLVVTLPILPQPVDKLDLLLVIDTTGSMGDELDYLKTELSSILGSISANNPGIHIRLGLVVYRDNGDEYVTRTYEFTEDVAELQSTLNDQDHDGGGDYPEAMDKAMQAALAFEWREEAVKTLLLVADAPPHDDRLQATWETSLVARDQQIHILPLAASGAGPLTEFIMRGMAVLTNSRYLFLTDDSGYGDSHDEPTTDCYVVTRLDQLVSRVINSLLEGERIEPSEDEIIRTVGHYNAGVCEPPEQEPVPEEE
ncbi:vWA domain-containing protein [Marinimicrobium sp. C2-29]|uniref:vWA domain-containing protein n=1 Tax=Marinimicrobium sp. C2-29 TaxID=3139825 RepID=UPI0031386ED8